jgi:cyclopropane fatty-acyl-phospholipid synthase-like methyltransferase
MEKTMAQRVRKWPAEYGRAIGYVCNPKIFDATNQRCMDILTQAGLTKKMTLLDVGAGVLGPGYLIMDYLWKNKYSAIEPNGWLIDTAEKFNENKGKERGMKVYNIDDFKLTKTLKKYDYVFSHSIIPHATRAQIVTMFEEAYASLKEDGTMVMSFYDNFSTDADPEAWVYPSGVQYTAAFINRLAWEAGFKQVDTFLDREHPSNHSWVIARKFPGGNIKKEADQWENTIECNKSFVERYEQNVNQAPHLKKHRDFVEKHVYGFGHRSFHWMWSLLVQQMPRQFRFLEVGVYKGQVVSLIRMLAPEAHITGVTRLDNFSGVTGKFPKFPQGDYLQHITNLHDEFDLPMPEIFSGDSTDQKTHDWVSAQPMYDIVYIDGCHEYPYVVKDLTFYTSRLKVGGYLVIDDSANYLAMPFGYFAGIDDVSKAVRDIIEPDVHYQHLFAVMHNRVFRKT